ncbi:hypothetical protein M441DRAFT_133205, partial [Trichoderma asperellum CBS 433.97]
TQLCWGFNGYEGGYNHTDQYGVYRYGFVFYIQGRYFRAFNRLHYYHDCIVLTHLNSRFYLRI